MASQKKSKFGKSKQNKDDVASNPLLKVTTPIMIGNQEFVPTPSLRNEQIAIYASQVMIPFTLASDTLGYMGPILNVSDISKLKRFFPAYHLTRPIASKPRVSKKSAENTRVEDETIPQENTPQEGKEQNEPSFKLDFVTEVLRPFRSGPSKEDKKYLGWLARIEKAKSKTWKNLGIFDLIHLSKFGSEYCQLMITASLYFWDSTYNTFHLPCGMLTPTLFDVAAITGLRPT